MADARTFVESWWRGERGLAGSLLSLSLAPAEMAFRAVVGLRNTAYTHGWLASFPAPIPVISIGNLSVGGSGKTPLSAWAVAQLRERGRHPAIVLRGYGEDEIIVHSELNPGVSVHRKSDRLAGVTEAAGAGADCVVVDDGFQHQRLKRDLDIVLVSAEQWGVRRRLLPRGPWREPAGSLRRATHILVTRKSASREDAEQVLAELRGAAPGAGYGLVHLASGGLRSLHNGELLLDSLGELAGRKVTAVTTLADPRPLVAQLTAAGARVEVMAFGDHHEFTDGEIDSIAVSFSETTGVVTRKEAVKLRGRLPLEAPALVLDQRVIFEEGEEELLRAMDRIFERNT
ncbi:MAG: tetraacyldisaccharide 4'-kinase [Gemmatimonadota bacterium]|jgi:tetraacyldisaccharide 4'-kinase|nr:tetraacyldisaccharide 4'-kinase [Gemmatimonadota bacterium]